MLAPALKAVVREDWPHDDEHELVAPAALPAQLADVWRGTGMAGPPDGDVWELLRWIAEVTIGEPPVGDANAWRGVIGRADRLAEREPLAATVAALAAVGAWYGAEQPTETPGQRGADVNWGWTDLVLPAVGILERADAFWTAQALGETAVSAIEWSMRMPWSVKSLATLEGVRSCLLGLEARYREELAELSWAIRDAVRRPGLDRARLAATLWTAGDPQRAHALADHGYVPSLAVIADLADAALWHGQNPFLRATWARMWGPGTSLREADHRHLARRSVSYGPHSAEHLALDAVFRDVVGHSLFAAFARVVVAWFDGEVSAEEVGTIEFALPHCKVHPPTFVRMAALDMLITEGPDGSQRDWRTIAHSAAKVAMYEHITGSADPYDSFVDVPLYYLRGNDDEVLEHIEAQRRAGLHLWSLLSDRPRDLPAAAQPIVEERRQMLDEVRAVRLVLQFPSMPQRLQLGWSMFSPHLPPPAAGWSDAEEALKRLWELMGRLQELDAQIEAVAPACAAQSRAGGNVEEFVAALDAHGIEA